jgi:hypothetical protein
MSPKILFCVFTLVSLAMYSCSDDNKETSTSLEPVVFKKIPSSQSGINFNNLVDENYSKNNFDAFGYVYNGQVWLLVI